MRRQLRVGDVAVAPLPGGGFGACQVSGFDGESVVVHALDWSSPEPPGLDDLRGIGPAILRSHRFREEIAQTSVAPRYHPLPPEFTWIGNLPVPPGVPGQVNSISGWDWPLIATVLERDWADLPEEVRAARRLSRGADPVTIDRGAGPQTETTALASLDLTSWPVDRPMDWSVLDRLPRCTEISWSGPDRGLVAALARHPQISALNWFDAPETVNLSHTRVATLRISGAALRDLHLPPRARTLTIDGAPPLHTTYSPAAGHTTDHPTAGHTNGRSTASHTDNVAPGRTTDNTPATHATEGSAASHTNNTAAGRTTDNTPAAHTTDRSAAAHSGNAASARTADHSAAGHTTDNTAAAGATGGAADPAISRSPAVHTSGGIVPVHVTDGGSPIRTVHARDDGRWLHLDIFSATTATVAPAGLSQVRSMSLSGAGALSAGTVAVFPSAHTLTLRWTSPPGRLDDPAALTALPHLRLLEMFDAYAVDAETLPDLPLDDLLIHGLRGSTARSLRARFRKSPTTLSLMGAKSDSWLAANLDNPFRDWADDHPAAGAAACKAYAKALKALADFPASKPAPTPATATKQSSVASPTRSPKPAAATQPSSTTDPAPPSKPIATAETPSTAEHSSDLPSAGASVPAPVAGSAVTGLPAASVEGLLRELVGRLNAIDEKFDIIDTIRREEAADAFMALAARAGVPATLADEWFDTWRDF